MFQDLTTQVYEFHSSWKSQKKMRDNGSQTSEIITYDVQVQSAKPHNVECQTESILNLMEPFNTIDQTNVENIATLVCFLQKAEPVIMKQVKINNSGSNLYTGILKERRDHSQQTFKCELVLEDSTTALNSKMQVTCISWTSSGASIAVAYGTNDSISWSEDRSFICLWNLDRPNLNNKVCDHKVELESSVQVVSCHPQLPGLVTAGLYSGVVVVWNLAKDELLYSESSHADPVTSLCWMPTQNSSCIQLLSGSTDGSISIWKLQEGKGDSSLKMEKHLLIKASYLPRRSGVRGKGPIGITCFCPVKSGFLDGGLHSTTPEMTDSLVVGCENGAILKCSLEANVENPITFVYESHVGPVYSLDWSPFHRHLFLSCSSDQICRVYHSLQSAALREIRPDQSVTGGTSNYLYSAFWSVSNPTLFFVSGASGQIEACDIKLLRCVASCDVLGSDGKVRWVNHMQPNRKRASMFASASKEVHVWRLGSALVESEQEEQGVRFLDDLSKEAMT